MKISYIITTYNRLETLIYHLYSIRLQDYACDKLEVIVCDDGSNDGTIDFCTKSKLVDIYCNTNSYNKATPAKARNMGIDLATGDLLIFADDDCLPHHSLIDNYSYTKKGTCSVGYRSSLKSVLAVRSGQESEHIKKEGGRPVQYFDRWVNNNFIWHHFASGSFAIWCKDIAEVRFDEEFEGYGYEDRHFAWLLNKKGITFDYVFSAMIYHCKHAKKNRMEEREEEKERNKQLFLKKTK